ncbi:unnamed protein product [Closterium sp. NIES-53]
MASPTLLTFDTEGRAVAFDVWIDDLQLFLQCDSRDGLSLFDLTSGASTSPAANADSTVRSQWLTRDAAARLAVRSHLPPTERAHFSQYKSAKTLYDAVVARYSSPATAALSRLILPYLLPNLAAFATVTDLITHLRTSDTRYRAALPAEFCAQNPPPHAAALGASESAAPGARESATLGAGESALSGTASAQVFHTFTLDSGASRSFFRDRTTLTPLSRPLAVSLVDPSGGPVLARYSTVLPCSAAPSGSLSHLYLPSFSTNLVSGADLQDGWVHQFTPASQRVTHCTCAQTGRHLATFTRRPGLSLYTLTTESPPFAASGQVAVSSQVFAAASRSGPESAPCSCRLLSHQTLVWHHRLGHPSLPRLRGMASRVLVSGLPRSLPPLPPGPAPTCVPCVEGRQRAAPHSFEFPPTEAPLQTLHMDVWGPARVRGQGHERYFLLVVDDYSRYTTVFPLRSKGDVTEVLIVWIRAARLQLRERFGSDFPVLRLHSDRGREFSSDLLRAFCRAEGIRQTFTLPASPQQNEIAERRIGMVMDIARTSMIHAAAPHFLWPFAVQYAAHQINIQPRVSLPETSPTLRWTGQVGDASAFRVWGSRAFVRDLSPDKLSSRAVPWVFLGFPPDAPCWQFYHPTLRRVLSSQDVTFDELVPYYRLFPYRTAPLPPPPAALPRARTTLAALGFAPSTADPSLFLRTDTSLPPFYILVYVDDLVFATADTAGLAHVKSELQKRHTCTDLGELRSYLCLQITRDRARRTITLTQSHMVQQVLQRFDFTYSSPQATPLSTRHSLSALPSDESVEPSGPYPELVGCLMYLMTCTRPDLAYPLSILARYVAPGRHRPEHMAAAGGCCATCARSSQGYTFSLGSGSVSWRSTRSSSVLSSSCEAEIYAGAIAAQELRWLTYLLTDLGEPPSSPPVLYVDNKAMLALCREHRLEHRTKHIALRYFLARELQQRGQLRLAYVASQANTADIFTKALQPCDHQCFCTMLACFIFALLDWSWFFSFPLRLSHGNSASSLAASAARAVSRAAASAAATVAVAAAAAAAAASAVAALLFFVRLLCLSPPASSTSFAGLLFFEARHLATNAGHSMS